MAKNNFNIYKMLTIDESGMPAAPDVRQLLDKDLLQLYARDTTTNKSNYVKECGVIYWLGDPNSPAGQQGLSETEALKDAIKNFDLPKDYLPDVVVKRLIDKYHIMNITEAGVALESLRKSIHLISLASVKINDILNKKLTLAMEEDTITSVLALSNEVKNMVKSIPDLTKALATAYENLRSEEEEQMARGGKLVLSSMDANETY